jgi:hypothetical protein
MRVEKFEMEDEGWRSYGFMVYNRSGYSLPKGMISSFKAEQFSDMSVEIEMHIQSPSGDSPDSSDHLTYNMPAINSFAQAKLIVDMYAQMVEYWITAESKTESL